MTRAQTVAPAVVPERPARGRPPGAEPPSDDFAALLDTPQARTAPTEGQNTSEPLEPGPATDTPVGEPVAVAAPVAVDGLPAPPPNVAVESEPPVAPVVPAVIAPQQPAVPVAPAQPPAEGAEAETPVVATPPVAVEPGGEVVPAGAEDPSADPQSRPGRSMGDQGGTTHEHRPASTPERETKAASPSLPLAAAPAEKATPAVPAAPATPATPASNATTAAPATPAIPVQPAAPTAATQAPVQHQPVLLADRLERIHALVQLAQAGGSVTARLELHPLDLGRVDVLLRQSADGVIATVTAREPTALETLQQAGTELRRSLEDRGVTVARLDLQLGAQADERRQAAARGHAGSSSPGSATGSVDGDDAVTDQIPTITTTAGIPAGALVDVQA